MTLSVFLLLLLPPSLASPSLPSFLLPPSAFVPYSWIRFPVRNLGGTLLGEVSVWRGMVGVTFTRVLKYNVVSLVGIPLERMQLIGPRS